MMLKHLEFECYYPSAQRRKKLRSIAVSIRIKVDDSSFYNQKVCERSFLMLVGITQSEIGSKHYKKLKFQTYQYIF